MSEATLEIARPARKRLQPAREHAKQHASADAVLTQPTRCAIDLPTLDLRIPRTIVLSLDTQQTGCLTDSMLNLATLGSDLPGFELQQDKTFVENVILAADYLLHQAIAPVKGSVGIRWWGSAQSAANGTNPVDGYNENYFIEGQDEKHVGANAVIEFDLLDDGETHHATTMLNSSAQLERCESICPGFTHLLYTVLECVNDTVWPIITPRSFWNDMRFHEHWYGLKTMCDAEVAREALAQEFGDDGIDEKYGVGDIDGLDPIDVVSIYEEEIAGSLPSGFITRFGRAAIGQWTMGENSEHESIPDPQDSIAADICRAMASIEARLPWCPVAPIALKHLTAMHAIVRSIANGARLAMGANYFDQPSHSAIQVHRFGNGFESYHFQQSLDDFARGAMECGEVVDATGWRCTDMSTLDKAAKAISTMEQGVAVLQTTSTLLLDLFYDPKQDD